MKCVCPDCAREMSKDQIGVTVAFYAKVTGHSRPYDVFQADLFRCPGCNKRVVGDFAQQPMWRHHNDDPMPYCDFASYERGMNLPTEKD